MNTEIKKQHFNIIDLIVLIAVAACIVGVFLRYNVKANIAGERDTATVTVLVETLLEDDLAVMHEGDQFYYSSSDDDFGILESIESSPAKARFFSDDANSVTVTYSDRVDVVCTFQVTGTNTSGGFMVNGKTYIGSGSYFNMKSRSIEVQCTVLDVSAEN